MTPRPPRSTLFPTRRSSDLCPVEGLAVMRHQQCEADHLARRLCQRVAHGDEVALRLCHLAAADGQHRSEEHTSELQSLRHLVCRLLLEKKKKKYISQQSTIY